jgi:glycosyltransferase involved in cell wall biosynthesis
MKTKKIKVAHIITRFIIGGAQENTLLTVVGLQRTNKYEVTLISGPTQGPEGSLEEQARRVTTMRCIPHLVRNIHPVADFFALCALYRLLKQGNFDIVHTHSSKAGILGRIAAKLAGIPIIVHTIHGLPFFREQHPLLNTFYVFLEKYTARFTNKIISVSPSIIDDAIAAGIAPKEKFTRIYSGIDLSLFKNDGRARAAIRKKIGIPEQSPVVGTIARLFYHKGHEYLLKAAVLIRAQVPEAKILLVGDGVLKEKLLQSAQRLGIQDMVFFAGLVQPEEIPLYLQAVTVLAHVSLHEGLPRAVVQGFAAAVPAVCFNVDGARNIINNGVNGYLVDPKNTDQLASRLIELLKDPEKAALMGKTGQALARTQFGAGLMVSSIDGVYQEILACGT